MHIAATSSNAQWMVEQLRQLKIMGHDVQAVIPATGRVSQALEAEGISCHFIDLDLIWNSGDFFKLFKRVLKLARLMYQQKCDVVHYHMFTSSILARIAAWMTDCPVRVRMVPEIFYLEADTPALLEYSTCWMDTSIVPSCNHVRSLYLSRGIAESRLARVYYGVDTTTFDPSCYQRTAVRKKLTDQFNLPPDSLIIAHIAYFIPPFEKSEWIPSYLWGKGIKGHELLIEAMPMILKVVPKARFLLVGTYPPEVAGPGLEYIESLKERIQALNLSGCVTFTGYIDNVRELLAAIDIAVQPSISENLGGAIESLLMQVPTVVTGVGGMIDAVHHGQTGLVAEPGNPKSLADQIIAMADLELASKLARAGRDSALATFSLDLTVDKLAGIYKLDLDKKPSGYRAYIILCRAWPAIFTIAWVGFICCRSELQNRLFWWWHQGALRGLYLAQKRLGDVSLALCLILLWPALKLLRPAHTIAFKKLTEVLGGASSFVGLNLNQLCTCSDKGCLRSQTPGSGLKKGITGWANLNHRPDTTCKELSAMDELYTAHANPILDAKILLKSLWQATK